MGRKQVQSGLGLRLMFELLELSSARQIVHIFGKKDTHIKAVSKYLTSTCMGPDFSMSRKRGLQAVGSPR